MIIYMPMVPEAVDRDARVRAARRDPLGRVRRLRGERAREPHRRRAAEGRRVGVVRDRAGARRRVQAAARRGDRASAESKPERCIVLQRPQLEADARPGRDLDWDDAVAGAEPADCVAVEATDPLYILYTSGTTGQPKGIVRDNGGHAVALEWTMKNIYDVEPGEVFWAASDIGWVVGHSYIVYAPLLHGCTTVLYEGKPVGTPDAGAFWRVIAEHGVCDAVHRADGVPRDPAAGPRGRAHRRLRPLAASARSSSPASAAIRRRCAGPRRSSACR